METVYNTTCLSSYEDRFGLPCAVFSRSLLTASQLISFPAGTKMLQFPAFALLSESKTKSYSGISGSKVTCTSPELTAACRTLHRSSKPSYPSHSDSALVMCVRLHVTSVERPSDDCVICQPFASFRLAKSLSMQKCMWNRICNKKNHGPVGTFTNSTNLIVAEGLSVS